MKEEKILRPIDITVVPGVTLTITIPQIFLKKGKCHTLKFCLTEAEIVKLKSATRTEAVLIQNGVGGISYVLEDSSGDIFYADKLLLGFCYRIKFGNNGPAVQAGTVGLIAHFININTPCCSIGIDPANATIPADGGV